MCDYWSIWLWHEDDGLTIVPEFSSVLVIFLLVASLSLFVLNLCIFHKGQLLVIIKV